jgi:hypothetical protein
VIFQAWSIHLYGQWLDTVFLNPISDSGDPDAADTVKRSLIAQGYDDRIVVRLWRSIPLHQVVFCRSLTGRQHGAH